MRKFVIILLACGLAGSAQAQSPVRHDVLKALSEIPAPPTTVQAAYDSVSVDLTAGLQSISAARIFAAVEGRLKAAEDDYKAQEPASPAEAAAAAIPQGMSADMARMASDPELREKMKSMSKEERKRMALAMASSAMAGGAPTVAPEPPEVQAAAAAWQKLALDAQAEFERGVERQKAALAAGEADRAEHEKVEQWEREALAALPQISSGEMSAPDPAAVKAVRLEAAEMHLAAAQQRLDAFRKGWPGVRDHVQERYGDFHAKLVACDYASGAQNFATRKILSDGQMTLLKEIAADAQSVRDEFEAAARWVAYRKIIENQ